MNEPPDARGAGLEKSVDHVCDRFEEAWLAGTPPAIERLVEAAPEPVRARLLRELIAVEREYRAGAGCPLSPREAFDRFAGLGNWAEVLLRELFPSVGDWATHDYPAATLRADHPAAPAPDRWITRPSPGPLSRALDPLPADLPKAIGKYAVLGVLGRGGMGAVYLAEHPELRRTVAVKVMRPELAARPGARDRFMREARAAAKIQHDNVVAIYDVDEADSTPFIVMPHLRGESLEDRLRVEPIPPILLAVRVARETAEGLAAAAAVGLVHRDVKPANVWLEGDTLAGDPAMRVRRVKVLDFGLARAADLNDGLTAPGAVVGTPAYMAPEQADGRDVDPRSDLFSLGCVLYRMLTGRPAFEGVSVRAVLKAVTTHHPPPPRDVNPAVPEGLSALVMKLLEKDPACRPQTAGEAVAELREVEWDEPASPSAARSRGRRHGSRTRRWIAAAIFFLPIMAAAALVGRRPSDLGPTPSRDGIKKDANLVVRVSRQGFEARPLDEVVPLRDGDAVQARFSVPPSVYACLVYVNASGHMELLQYYPPGERAVDEATWPGPGQAKPLRPPAGTELLFVCGRNDRLPEVAELQAAWAATTGWPALEPKGKVFRLRSEGVSIEGSVGRDFGTLVEVPDGDAVKRRLEQFRIRLLDVSVLDGVTFRHE